jgi:cytochrome c-type biogenesis protein CcmH/NrfG
MRHLPWIAVGLTVVLMVLLAYPLLQTTRQLRRVQSELTRANEQVVQVRAGTAELERVVANLKAELDEANKARTELHGKMAEATTDNGPVEEGA